MDAGLIPTFGSFAWTIAAFIVALSIIVAIHEYGHYIVGKWSGIKAEVFSIGFGPVLLPGYTPPDDPVALKNKLEKALTFGPALLRARWRG